MPSLCRNVSSFQQRRGLLWAICLFLCLQVPDTVEAAIREADVLDQDGNISLEEFEALMHSADTDVLDLFDTRHHS